MVRHREVSVAHFASSAISDLGGDRYEVAGQLTIKGDTHDAVDADHAEEGCRRQQRRPRDSFTLKRLDYKIGEGQWADPDTVANDVVVRVRMVLPPLK